MPAQAPRLSPNRHRFEAESTPTRRWAKFAAFPTVASTDLPIEAKVWPVTATAASPELFIKEAVCSTMAQAWPTVVFIELPVGGSAGARGEAVFGEGSGPGPGLGLGFVRARARAC